MARCLLPDYQAWVGKNNIRKIKADKKGLRQAAGSAVNFKSSRFQDFCNIFLMIKSENCITFED
jgi:hypothetical protein